MTASTSKAMYGKPYTGHDYDGPLPEPEQTGSVTADVERVTDLRSLATRAALLQAIQRRVAAEATAAREELDGALREARRAEGTKGIDVTVPDPLAPDGARVAATVGFNKAGKPTVSVTNMEDAVEWVARNHPTFIREVIDPLFLTNLLKSLVIDGDQIIEPKGGEVIGWASARPGAPGAMVVRFPDDGHDALLAAWLDGLMADVQVGALPAPSTSPGQGA